MMIEAAIAAFADDTRWDQAQCRTSRRNSHPYLEQKEE
jgi:hypothetical protein